MGSEVAMISVTPQDVSDALKSIHLGKAFSLDCVEDQIFDPVRLK
jgi:hypothetical protein